MKYQSIVDRYYEEAVSGLNEDILSDMDVWYSYVLHLPTHLEMVYTVLIFHQQVLNGGLHQYFFNSYGQFAYLTIENLKLIKAFRTADILERSLLLVNDEGYDLNEFRKRIFERRIYKIADFDDNLIDLLTFLDDEYDSLDENIEELMVEYLVKK